MAFFILIASFVVLCASESLGYPLYLNSFSYDSFGPQTSYEPQSSYYSTSSFLEQPQFSNFLPSFPPSFGRTPFFSSYPSPGLQPPHSEYNFFAESPYSIASRLVVVPLIVVPQTQINMVTEGQVKGMPTKKHPILTVQTSKNIDLQCTPAVRVVLQEPIVVTAVRSKVLFPAEMSVIYNQLRVPINIGAVIAPVLPDTEVSPDFPLSISVVYAIPGFVPDTEENTEISIEKDVELNKPLNPKPETSTDSKASSTDYVNNDKDVTVNKETQAVIVENPIESTTSATGIGSSTSEETTTPSVGKPEPVIAEEDDDADKDLVNRNPPQGSFSNSKESDVLNELREQSKKERLRI